MGANPDTCGLARDPPGQVGGQELRGDQIRPQVPISAKDRGEWGLRLPVYLCLLRVQIALPDQGLRIAAARAVGWVALSAPEPWGACGCPADPPVMFLAAEWSLVFVTSSCDLWSSFQCPLSPRSSHLPRSGIERVLSSPLQRTAGKPQSSERPAPSRISSDLLLAGPSCPLCFLRKDSKVKMKWGGNKLGNQLVKAVADHPCGSPAWPEN